MQYTYSRSQRVSDELKRQVAEIIRLQIADPRLKNLSVTDVKLSPNLRHAKIFYTCLSNNDENVKKALRKAVGFVRSTLAKKVTPALYS